MNEPKRVIASEQLSFDELQVADLLLMGFSRNKISEKLKLYPLAVKTHCSAIILKRGCKTMKELLDKGSEFVFNGKLL